MENHKPSLWNALAILVVGTVLVVWIVSSLTNEDLLWFVRAFNAQADWITVYWDGQQYLLVPGDPGYAEIMAAFSDGVAHWSGYEGSVGLSDESLERFRNEWRLLELHYNQPVQIHTRHPYSEARNYLVPLSGSHATMHRVFAGLNETPRIGVLNMSEARFNALRTAVESAVSAEP